jgi:alpha-L-fucosidase
MPFKLPALPVKVESAALLDGFTVAIEQTAAAFTVTVPQEKLDPSITVVKLTIEGDPLALALIPPPSTTGSLAYRKPATASTSVAPRYMHQASAAFDDNPRTFWSPGRDEQVANTLYGKSIHYVTPDRPLWPRESWLEVDSHEPKTSPAWSLPTAMRR